MISVLNKSDFRPKKAYAQNYETSNAPAPAVSCSMLVVDGSLGIFLGTMAPFVGSF